ncbi:MAG: sensor histidine kinase, partial [Kamptonema sp. SIO4C4]|nr:sensor histidine kinase [Kamptonema sp. SIO4C4]
MSSLRFSSHPLKFLLYLEWSLLGIILIAELLRFYWFRLPRFPFAQFPLVSLGCLVIFGIMGILLPRQNTSHKILYTVSEFLLVFIITGAGLIRLVSLLYIVIVIRNCFIFQGKSRVIITGVAYLAFLFTQFQRMQYRFFRQGWNILESERFLFLTLMSALLLGLVLVG